MEDMKFESLMPAPDAMELQQLENNVKKIATEMNELLQDHDHDPYYFRENIERYIDKILKLLKTPQALLMGLKRSELKRYLDVLHNDAVRTGCQEYRRPPEPDHIKNVCIQLYTLFDKLQPTRYLYNSLECHTKYMEFINKAVKKSTKCPVTLHIASAPHLNTNILHHIVTRVKKAAMLKVIYHFRYNGKESGTYFLQVIDHDDRPTDDKTEKDRRKIIRKYFRENKNHEIRIYYCRHQVGSMNGMHRYMTEIKTFTDKYARNMKVEYYFKEEEFNKLMRANNDESSEEDNLERQELKSYFITDRNHRINLVKGGAQYYFHTKWAAYSAELDQSVNLLLTSANLIDGHLKSIEEVKTSSYVPSRILNSIIEGTIPCQNFTDRFLSPMRDGHESVKNPVTMTLDSTDRLRLTWPAGNYNDVQIYQQVKEFVEEALLMSENEPCVLHIVSPFVDYATIMQIILRSSKELCSGALQLNVTCKNNEKLKELNAATETALAIAIDRLKNFIKVLHDLKTPQDSQNTEQSLESLMKLLSLEDNVKLLQSVRVTYASDFHCKFIGYGPQAAGGSEVGIYEVLMTSANFDRKHMNASKEESERYNEPGYANLDWVLRLKVTQQDWKFMIGLIED